MAQQRTHGSMGSGRAHRAQPANGRKGGFHIRRVHTWAEAQHACIASFPAVLTGSCLPAKHAGSLHPPIGWK